MVWFDFLIIIIIILSSVISLIRGFVKEAMSLAAWVISFWISMRFSGGLATYLDSAIDDTTLRLIVAFFSLFVVSLIVFSIANFFLTKLVERSGMTSADRAIGVLFGFLRGVVLVAALVMGAGLTQFPKTDTWKDSLFAGHFQAIAIWLIDLLPDDVGKNFKY